MHSAEIKREIPFCTRKRILEYSGIEIRQFTHSAEIKREIPFCTRKRSETYSRPKPHQGHTITIESFQYSTNCSLVFPLFQELLEYHGF